MAHEDVETGNVTNDGVVKTKKYEASGEEGESRPGSSASAFAARLARASAKKRTDKNDSSDAHLAVKNAVTGQDDLHTSMA